LYVRARSCEVITQKLCAKENEELNVRVVMKKCIFMATVDHISLPAYEVKPCFVCCERYIFVECSALGELQVTCTQDSNFTSPTKPQHAI
jgi:hypothetical protein